MRFPALRSITGERQSVLLHRRWPWHIAFWTGYAIFRFWPYYITVTYYPRIFLEYMLLAELPLAGVAYFTLWLYRRLFEQKQYLAYFLAGAGCWILYLWGRTVFQFHYLQHEPLFQRNTFTDIFLNNVTVVVVYFLFITACKYVKDSYIRQQFESAQKEQQLIAEVNNLKSQIAPHFLFNTLNNLYGLAVDKSDKLPDLMLRLSSLLRHSLYETQRPQVPLNAEIEVLKSYIGLERIRLEDDLVLEFGNTVPEGSGLGIAPLLLIVFIENAFKHSKGIRSGPVMIDIKTMLEGDRFMLTVTNNYDSSTPASPQGIGLINVKRRLEVLYPLGKHALDIRRDADFYTVTLQLQLEQLNA